MNLSEIGKIAHDININNGWDVFSTADWPASNIEKDKVRFLCTHMALFHSEVSEATEAIRKRDRANFDEELADVVIRVASVAHGLGTDLETAIRNKMAKNATRGLYHGGKAV
jgi:NTP pyrophosphatase (non-canonical NTP hydrolase)